MPGLEVESWIGLFAPVGTPQNVVGRLSGEFVALANAPELRDPLFQQGIVAQSGGAEDLTKMLKKDMDRYRKIIALANIRKD